MSSEQIKHQFEIFADYFQIYVEDSGVSDKHLLGIEWDDDHVRKRLLSNENTMIISTARNMDVPLSIELMSEAPVLNLSEWDHVVECAISVPSGALNVFGGTDNVKGYRKVFVPPGTYNAYVCFFGLNTLSEDGLSGDDRYEVFLWPTSTKEYSLKVLKQFD